MNISLAKLLELHCPKKFFYRFISRKNFDLTKQNLDNPSWDNVSLAEQIVGQLTIKSLVLHIYIPFFYIIM